MNIESNNSAQQPIFSNEDLEKLKNNIPMILSNAQKKYKLYLEIDFRYKEIDDYFDENNHLGINHLESILRSRDADEVISDEVYVKIFSDLFDVVSYMNLFFDAYSEGSYLMNLRSKPASVPKVNSTIEEDDSWVIVQNFMGVNEKYFHLDDR